MIKSARINVAAGAVRDSEVFVKNTGGSQALDINAILTQV